MLCPDVCDALKADGTKTMKMYLDCALTEPIKIQ